MEQTHRGEETRSRILDAAGECFARHGYDTTSVAELCRCAGVTKGAFYHHFPSKQAVFTELLNRWLEGLDAQFAQVRQEAATVPEALLHMVDMAGRVYKTAGGQLPILLEFWDKAVHDQVVSRAMIAPYRRYRDFFRSIIEEGIAEGTLKSVDPEVAAQVIVSLAVGLVLQGALDPQGADWGQVARKCVQMLVDGMRR